MATPRYHLMDDDFRAAPTSPSVDGTKGEFYSALGAGLALLGGIAQASAAEAQGDYQDTIARINSSFAERNAEDAIKRGDTAANDYNKKVGELVSEQRSGYAAQNVDVNSGSAAAVQVGTAEAGIDDARKIRNNAIREALNYKMSGLDSINQGQMAQAALKNQARNSIITGGLQAATLLSRKG